MLEPAQKNPNDKNYWRGKVDAELKSINAELKSTKETIKENSEKTNKKLDKIDLALRNGGDKNPGLISQVRDVVKWKCKVEKISYAIMIAIVLDILFRVLNSQTVGQLFHNTP